MVRQPHREVHERLLRWAEASPPVPTSTLARLMGPVRPAPAPATRRVPTSVTRIGVGTKAFLLMTGLAVSGAAAAGVAHVAIHPPQASPPAGTGVESSSSPTPGRPGDRSLTPRPSTSQAEEPREGAPPLASPSTTPHPASSRTALEPSAHPAVSEDTPSDGPTPVTTPTASPTGPESGDPTSPTDPSSDGTETPTATSSSG